jgi:hypothetical protein
MVRFADVLVPEFDRHLAGPDGGRRVVPVIDDLHQVALLLARQWRDPLVWLFQRAPPSEPWPALAQPSRISSCTRARFFSIRP